MNWYLFAGYAVVWTVLFLFILFLAGRQRRLQREVEALAEERAARESKQR